LTFFLCDRTYYLMDTTQLIAWYGALVATIVAIINISTAWRDRSRIVVTGKPGMRVTANAPYDPTKDYIVITVRNKGQRPRTITNVGIKLKKGDYKVLVATDCAFKGHVELTEGQSDMWAIEQDEIDLNNIKCAFALDAIDKLHTGPVSES